MKKKIVLALAACLAAAAMASPADAYVQSATMEEGNLKLTYPLVYTENAAAQEKINSSIAGFVYGFRSAGSSGEMREGVMDFDMKYEDDDVISFILKEYRYTGGAHGMTHYYGLVYDKHTGERVPLSNYLRITLPQLQTYAKNHTYNADMGRLEGRDLFNVPTEVTENYYLPGDGAVVLLYQPYDLAAYAAGATRIPFDRKTVEYYNDLNRQ